MKIQFKTLSAACLAIGVSSAAFAGAAYHFHIDFSKGNGKAYNPAPKSYGDYDGGRHYDDHSYIKNSYAHAYNFQDGHVKLNVQAGVDKPKDNDGSGYSNKTYLGGAQGVYVGQFYGGLGVGWEIKKNDLDDDYHTVDDKNGRDFLVLDFHEKVALTKIDFDYFGPTNDHRKRSYADFQVYTVGIDGELIYSGDIPYKWGKIEFAEPLKGSSTYVIAPKTNDGHKTDYFKLRAVGGYKHMTVVPSPTAALGGLLLMTGLVARRRRHG